MAALPVRPTRLIAPGVAVLIALALFGPLTLVLLAVVAGECYVLYRGQREVGSWGWELIPKPVLYVLIAPGIILHELSHVIACLLCGVRPAEVVWFAPLQRRESEGLLGYVLYPETGVKRQTIIAAAPLWLLPLLLLGWSYLMLGADVLSDPLAAALSASPAALVLWGLVTLSAGQAAFPSTEDHIPLEGGFVLGLLALGTILITGALETVALIFLLPAIAAGSAWLGLRLLIHQRGLKISGSNVAGLSLKSSRICTRCLQAAGPEERRCQHCESQQFYDVAASGYVTAIPAMEEISCQSCGRARVPLYLRSFRAIYGEHSRPLVRKLGGYYCKRCVRKRFWAAERQTVFSSGWRVRGILSKVLNSLLNIPARLAPPFNLAASAPMHVDQIRAARDALAPAPTPAPDWWVSLPRSDQDLLLSGKNFYESLHVSSKASSKELKRAYRILVKSVHPDAGGSEEEMKTVNEAYYVLSDQALRYALDHLAELPESLKPVAA